MLHRETSSMVVGLLLAVCLAGAVGLSGCGSSSSPTGTNPADTTPPSLTNVTATDGTHVVALFNESLNKQIAEHASNYVVIKGTVAETFGSGLVAPGDTLEVQTAVLESDKKTVMLSLGSSMSATGYVLDVNNVEDLAGNAVAGTITHAFTGTSNPDQTPPEIVSHSPASGATGAGVGTPVIVEFSEPMDYGSVVDAFSLTSAGGTVPVTTQTQEANYFVFTPAQPLQNGTAYTVTVDTLARDWSYNHIPAKVTWNFTTTSAVDNTPPTLVSSTPTDGAVNVSVNTNISMTFSEAINQTTLSQIMVVPEIGDGVVTWSNGGRTVTFDPTNPLTSDTQYSLFAPPGTIRDLAGNGMTSALSIAFTTGATLATGRILGTISGDSLSSAANDPAGATVIASSTPLFGTAELKVGGTGVVTGNGTYTVDHLPDGVYYLLSAMDSNHDGRIDPTTGDAIGLYGVDFAALSGFEDSVTVSGGGQVTGADFSLYDPMAIVGTVTYQGTAYAGGDYTVYIGVLDTTGVDLSNPGSLTPDYVTDASWPSYPSWSVDELDYGLVPGTYYVGAYLDVNGNTKPDAGEPLAFYGSGGVPTPITLEHGDDALNVAIVLNDTAAAAAGPAVTWQVTKRRSPRSALRKIANAFR